jgi:hypothetical protein
MKRTVEENVMSNDPVDFQAKIIKFVAEYMDRPLALKSFQINDEGKLVYMEEPSVFHGLFTYKNIHFCVEVKTKKDQKVLHLQSSLGKMPYSYESSIKRAHALAALFAHKHLQNQCFSCDNTGTVWLIGKKKSRALCAPKICLSPL